MMRMGARTSITNSHRRGSSCRPCCALPFDRHRNRMKSISPSTPTVPFTCWLVLLVVLVGTTSQVHGFSAVATSNVDTKTIANKLSAKHIQTVNDWVASALGDNQDGAKLNRYASARALADSLQQRSSNGFSTAEEESSSLDDTGRQLTSTNSATRKIAATFPRSRVCDSDASVTTGSIPQQHELVSSICIDGK